MFEINPSVRSYAWGSRTALPELCGYPTPSPHPVAEYWFGAHATSPATVPGGGGLDEWIVAAPGRELGEQVCDEYENRLPYLVKLLAAEEALSLQAHPSEEQAREGFEREEARGVPLVASERNYKDANHKPELVVAHTEFHALAGFRTVADTLDLFDDLDVRALDPYRSMLAGEPDGAGVRAVFTTFVTLPNESVQAMVSEVVAAAVRHLREHGTVHRWASVATTIVELGERHPADPGVLGALLLNRITLQPGEAIYMGAGKLHAYLSGIAVEVQANSDNVLRGGLTPKHVDVPELLRVLDFTPVDDPVVYPRLTASDPVAGWREFAYDTMAAEFRVSRIDLEPGGRLEEFDDPGPQILLCTTGEILVTSRNGRQSLPSGRAVWVSASDADVTVTAPESAQFFRTRVADVTRRGDVESPPGT